jgi:hypothetical protein
MADPSLRAVPNNDETIQQPSVTIKPPNKTSPRTSTCPLSTDLNERIDDAERLLFYAAEAGIDIEATVRDAVLKAKTTNPDDWSDQTATNLLSALTTLAGKLKPVTADSLKECADGPSVRAFIRGYKRVAIWLAMFIIPFSVVTFVTSAISDAIRKDIETANALAVKLNDEDKRNVTGQVVTRDLQEFAATIRAIDARGWQLNFFVMNAVTDPLSEHDAGKPKASEEKGKAELSQQQTRRKRFELPAGLTDADIPSTVKNMIGLYQDVRYFGQSIREIVSTVYGAFGTCILPMLYALLGACAYLLRTLEEQIKLRTFTKSDAHVARFLIAAIAGAVVGMFSNFNITQNASIPPLAIAFLVGYAADVFFSFLEGLLQTFTRRADPQTQAASKS